MNKDEMPFTETDNAAGILTAFWNLFALFASFRTAMLVKEAKLLGDAYLYYCCPRCGITLDREFVRFCDRCGQRLDWTQYRKVKIILPNKKQSKVPGKEKSCRGFLLKKF